MARQSKLRGPDPASVPKALAEVRAVYHSLAGRPLDRQCTQLAGCCHFRLTGKVPHLTRGEALVLAAGLRASGRVRVADHPEGACPLLAETGRCVAYEARPFGCRTHFCAAAGGPAERRAVIDLIHRLEAVDESLGGDGAKPLPQALREAMTSGRPTR